MTRIPTQREYEDREAQMFYKQLEGVEKAPLAERKEAATEWGAALQSHPKTVAERVGWLLAGNYGYGSYVKARQVACSPRMNRVASLAQMIAALEWQAPSAMARSQFSKLSPQQKKTVNEAVAHEIKEWERENPGCKAGRK
jgi:hypothetical protein